MPRSSLMIPQVIRSSCFSPDGEVPLRPTIPAAFAAIGTSSGLREADVGVTSGITTDYNRQSAARTRG